MNRAHPRSNLTATLCPYTTLVLADFAARSAIAEGQGALRGGWFAACPSAQRRLGGRDVGLQPLDLAVVFTAAAFEKLFQRVDLDLERVRFTGRRGQDD